jgi:hypothetical protein
MVSCAIAARVRLGIPAGAADREWQPPGINGERISQLVTAGSEAHAERSKHKQSSSKNRIPFKGANG